MLAILAILKTSPISGTAFSFLDFALAIIIAIVVEFFLYRGGPAEGRVWYGGVAEFLILFCSLFLVFALLFRW